ncbi:MAG: aminotransferase-like domain-containing protein [Pseudomarimonas sp.]
MTLYRQYASEIAAMIAVGQLRPGDRLPSVREAKARRGISASTVFQAYQLLERDGLIVARPQSGFYVNLPVAERSATPSSASDGVAAQVQVSELVFHVLSQVRSRGVAPLGSAFPGPELFPLSKLARAACAGLEAMDPGAVVEHLSPGFPRLIEQIELRYRIDGIALMPGEIVVTHGALEALNAALQLTTKPGDTVVVESPAFYAALQAIERLGLKALSLPTSPVTGLDLNALETVLTKERIGACWLMPTFQNPTGALMPAASKRDLVALLARHQVPLIEDDVYGELYFGNARPRPAKAFDDHGLVLHCSSFSKSLAPGYRIGWVAAGRYAQALQRHTLMTTMCASMPAQIALTQYLQTGGFDRHLRRLRGALHARLTAASAVIESAFPSGTRISRPRGGYFLWVELPPGLDAMTLHALALAEHIGIAPGHLFSPDTRYAHYLRINVGHDSTLVLPALRRLGALAHTLDGDSP